MVSRGELAVLLGSADAVVSPRCAAAAGASARANGGGRGRGLKRQLSNGEMSRVPQGRVFKRRFSFPSHSANARAEEAVREKKRDGGRRTRERE